ncbi:hypothetical protein U2P60_19765 [Brucella sp. H1_1004]|uniref:hypothetical protein n=1 Tax=Brucella sp. H1_1004 TaxID=3110109 RepID=UPI0039B5A642
MDENDIAALEEALSLERFSRYLAWANGDRAHAVELYTLNSRLSACFHISLHMLEVVLRNRIHAVASQWSIDNWESEEEALPWYDCSDFQIGAWQSEQLQKAKNDLLDDHKPIEAGRVVAALTFSYWTAFFGKGYEELWQRVLHRIGKRPNGKGLRRKDFSSPLTPLRLLRNRIAHHEPILSWNLPKHHSSIIELTNWLSPAASEWSAENCLFAEVFPNEGIKLAEIKQK